MIRRADPPNDDDSRGNKPDDPLSDLPSSGKPYDPLDKDSDCFKPPAEPTEVGCLHCQGIFMSDQMTYRIDTNADGEKHGFWCCPDPTCDGKGFGFDLLPTDPNYRDENGDGWVFYDDDEEDDDYDDEDDLFNTDYKKGPDSFDPPKDWTGDEDDEDDIPF